MAEFPHFRQKMEDTSHHQFSSSAAAGMNFSIGRMHPQQAHSHGQQPVIRQTFSQVHASSNASAIGARNAGRRPEAGNLQDATSQQLGHGHPGVHPSLHASQQQTRQNSQQFMDLGQVHMLPGGDGDAGGAVKGGQFSIGDPNLHAALVDIQQKIERMQELVRMNGEGGQANVQQQQQVASAVSLISQVTAAIHEGMLNQNQTQNMSMSDSSQLNHLFGACSSAGFNFFDHPGSSPVNADMVVGNNNNNAFSSLPGRMGGNNHDQNTNNLNGLGHGHSISGNPPATTGDQIFGHGAVTTPSGSAVLPSETAGVGNLRQPPLNNRIAPRPGAVSGMNASGKPTINRSSPGVMVPSNSASGSHGSDEQEMVVRSRGGASRDEYDDGEGEILVVGSYQLVELDDQEILAEHTHFCELCGKGFKRDANLRMHMRSHGDEYKTPEALARPQKPIDEQTPEIPKRFSCPHIGCKRNVKHRKFQPLKSLLCVKNHYRRSHCAKNLACSKCKVKKFSVVADLKTHEKHCGCDKWQCSCGTTFSRKDKLFGHVSLFVGHSPAALPLPDSLAENSAGSLDIVEMAPVGANVDTGGAESTSMVQQGLANQVSAGGYAHWTQQLF